MSDHNFETELPDGTPVRVYYEYIPGEAAVRYPNDRAQPEVWEEADIEAVYPLRTDKSEMPCCLDCLDQEEMFGLEAAALEHQHELQEFNQSKRDAMEEDRDE